MIAEQPGAARDALAPATLWPARLVVVDLERCPDEISAERAEGGRYRALLALVRVGGVPRGLVTVPLAGERIAAAELEPYLRTVADGAAVSAPPQLPEPPPSFTIVVPTVLERPDELRRCVDALGAIEYPDVEILVVDNRRAGGAVPAWLEWTPHIRLLEERRPGVSAGRNRGLAEAAGELVVFIDDDVTADPGLLAAYARRFAAHPAEVAVAGLILPDGIETAEDARIEAYYGGYGSRRFEPLSHALERPRRPGRPFRRATIAARDDAGEVVERFSLYEAGKLGAGANVAFRTAALRALGGFDTDLGPATPTRSGEDVAILMRAAWRGHAIGFEPAAFVRHTDRRGDGALRAKLDAYGTGVTAILTALVAEDAGHLGALAATVPEALRRLAVYFGRKLRDHDHGSGSGSGSGSGGMAGGGGDGALISSVSSLARIELRGMLRGPFAYARSRLGRRRRLR